MEELEATKDSWKEAPPGPFVGTMAIRCWDERVSPSSVVPVRPLPDRPRPVSYTHLTLPTICSV
eukprot:5036229-Prymnesium_polylepis.3